VTSIYNTHRNDGLAAIKYLRGAFDANTGDAADHAAHLARLQSRVIDDRRPQCHSYLLFPRDGARLARPRRHRRRRRDFTLDDGNFAEPSGSLGNDVTPLQTALKPAAAVLAAVRGCYTHQICY